MSDTILLDNEVIKAAFSDGLAYRGQYIGDANDAPTGCYIVRNDAIPSNLPLAESGYFQSSSGTCRFQLYYAMQSGRMFVRVKWYGNAWLAWREIALTTYTGSLTSRGG